MCIRYNIFRTNPVTDSEKCDMFQCNFLSIKFPDKFLPNLGYFLNLYEKFEEMNFMNEPTFLYF